MELSKEEVNEITEGGPGLPYLLVYALRNELQDLRYQDRHKPLFSCMRTACSKLRDNDDERRQQGKDPIFTPKEHEMLIWYYSVNGDEMMDDCLMRDLDINEEELQSLLLQYRYEVGKLLGIRKTYADVLLGMMKITA